MYDLTPDEARVELGSRLLDQIIPNWHLAIDLSYLDIANPYCCVLCQIYGTYREGCERLDYLEETQRTLTNLGVGPEHGWGQQVNRLGFGVEDFIQNRTLTAAWTRFILARRAAQTAARA